MTGPTPLILTRPEAQSRAFAATLGQALPGRFHPVIAPVLRIVPMPAPLDLEGLQGLMFTSANGVEQFAAASPDRSLPAYCVGAMTAAAARGAGLIAHSAEGDVEALARLVAAHHRPGQGAFLHIRGQAAAGDLIARLAEQGVPARSATLYAQEPVTIGGAAAALLGSATPLVLALFSPRSATLFAAQAREAGWDLGAARAVSLSAAADAALAGLGLAGRTIAETPDQQGMIAALARL